MPIEARIARLSIPLKQNDRSDFSDHFREPMLCGKRNISYNLNAIRQYVCFVIHPTMINILATLFKCFPMGRASGYDGTDLKHSILMVGVRALLSVVCRRVYQPKEK